MDMLELITPIILTYNESANLGRTLACLNWAKRVIVLDSGSSDETEKIARSFVNVDWRVRTFDSHAAQCNFALEQFAAKIPWVLFIDADYQVTAESVQEIGLLRPEQPVSGYEVEFIYCVDGKPLAGALYPRRTVLFRPERGRYEQQGHTQRLQLEGQVELLEEKFLHDDRKPAARFLQNQQRYAVLEARWLWMRPLRHMRWTDRARRMVIIAPWLAPAVALIWRGGIRDGWRGLRYAGERAVAETLVAWELLKLMLSRSKVE